MIIALPDGGVDTATGRVVRGGVETVLTSRGRGLLAHLAARAGQVVPTEERLREVWGVAPTVVTRALFHTMRRLRARGEPDPASPRLLLAEHGVGYRFVPWQEGPAKLVGRAAELRRIGEALRTPASPVFLFGPPGVGKSALVRAACEAHPNALLVDLEGLSRVEEVYERLAVALGLTGRGDLADRVDHPLAGRTLVALDGAEGVLAVDPLGPDDARRLLVTRLDRAGVPIAPDDPWIDTLAATTAGLPLALHLAASEARYVPLADLVGRLVEPSSLDPLRVTVTRSLARLPPDVRSELLRIVSFARAAHLAQLGAPAHPAHLDDDLGHRRPARYDALPELTRALDRTPVRDPLRPRLYAAIATARTAFGGFRGVAGGLRAELDAAPVEARAAFLGFLANLDTAAALDLDPQLLDALPADPELRPFLATQAASSERQLLHPDDATALARLAAALREPSSGPRGLASIRSCCIVAAAARPAPPCSPTSSPRWTRPPPTPPRSARGSWGGAPPRRGVAGGSTPRTCPSPRPTPSPGTTPCRPPSACGSLGSRRSPRALLPP